MSCICFHKIAQRSFYLYCMWTLGFGVLSPSHCCSHWRGRGRGWRRGRRRRGRGSATWWWGWGWGRRGWGSRGRRGSWRLWGTGIFLSFHVAAVAVVV